MRKFFLLSVVASLAWTLSFAQTSDRDAGRNTEQNVKGGSYVAPAQTKKQAVTVNKTQVQPVIPTSKPTPASVNPNAGSKTTTDDFPKFVNTGNDAADQANYAKAKQEWIARNPEKYREMQQAPTQSK